MDTEYIIYTGVIGVIALSLHLIITTKSFLYEPRLIFAAFNCIYVANVIYPEAKHTPAPMLLVAGAGLLLLASYGYYLIKERHSWLVRSLFATAALSTCAFIPMIWSLLPA